MATAKAIALNGEIIELPSPSADANIPEGTYVPTEDFDIYKTQIVKQLDTVKMNLDKLTTKVDNNIVSNTFVINGRVKVGKWYDGKDLYRSCVKIPITEIHKTNYWPGAGMSIYIDCNPDIEGGDWLDIPSTDYFCRAYVVEAYFSGKGSNNTVEAKYKYPIWFNGSYSGFNGYGEDDVEGDTTTDKILVPTAVSLRWVDDRYLEIFATSTTHYGKNLTEDYVIVAVEYTLYGDHST